MTDASIDLRDYIRDVPDFPKPGILFRDITPLLKSPAAMSAVIDRLAAPFEGQNIEVVAAAEARGFIFAAPLAIRLNAAFVPIRKPGKLPFASHSLTYELEYGTDTVQMHVDGVAPMQRVLVLDDLLATGGTVDACCQLLEKCDAEIVGCAFVINLKGLGGEQRLKKYPLHSLLTYE
ncbi:Adenine phosphoribosyltransferase [Rosistilla carotiformis]|uniref:Adenine phosphoribosyltransferase n=1 Tax=Rosistilla carotiformis TaxID=2528017 RepID=A0A518JRL5_9BACT|nr:adenine phosphoribosyltransferase [Rosistilla carotiformis]QDV68193.1 Adenine phosphoribosyltransferase [Rosistilla carotiformis]